MNVELHRSAPLYQYKVTSVLLIPVIVEIFQIYKVKP